MRASLPTAALVAALAAGIVTTVAAPAGGAVCSVDQLTESEGGRVLQVDQSADGSAIAFTATIDPLGANPDHNGEVFRYDVDQRMISQLTVSTGGETLGVNANANPAITADGGSIFFDSDRHFPGGGNDNTDGGREVFVVAGEGVPVQRTFGTASQDSTDPTINATGSRLAYQSTGNATVENGDGSWEIFHQRGTNALHVTDQVTAGAAGVDSRLPSLDDTGMRVAFTTETALGGANPDGNNEVALFTYGANFSGGTSAPVTVSTGDSDIPESELSDDGRVVVFVSERDLDAAHPGGRGVVWRHLVATGATTAVSPTFGRTNLEPTVASNGGRVAFGWQAWQRTANPNGYPEAFVHDSGIGRSRALDRIDDVAIADLDLDALGTHLALSWFGNPQLTNGDLNAELFVATCGRAAPQFRDVPRRHASFDEIQWLVATGMASGYRDGTFRPTATVNRQQVAAFLFGLAGRPPLPLAQPTYPDVPATSPFYEAVEWLHHTGVSTAAPGRPFGPTRPVVRRELVGLLFRLAGSPSFTPPATATFSDVPTTNPHFTRIEWAAETRVVDGYRDGTFRPTGAVTRQQIAGILHRFTTCCVVDV